MSRQDGDLSSPVPLDLALVDRVEHAALTGWPPTYVAALADGWILRATPGLDRGRASSALTPRTHPLTAGDLADGLGRSRAFSAEHGVRGGLQLSPLELHEHLLAPLLTAGWEPNFRVWVMVADRRELLERAEVSTSAGLELAWTGERAASPTWRGNWRLCQPTLIEEIVAGHERTVFANMGSRGIFGALAGAASGICVEDGSGAWAGLFSLIVRDGLRGLGLGRRLVRQLVAESTAERIYLQVQTENAVAISLYRSLGFRVSHSYQHLLAPLGWATSD